MIFTTTTSVLSGLRSAPAAFAAGEGFVISDANAPTIFSSQVSADMLPSLDALENITGASPEIFSFSSWNGHSFVVRGVNLTRLNEAGPTLSGLVLSPGESAGGIDSALIGERLLERLGIRLPYTIPVVGSYNVKIQFLRIVGWFRSDSPLDDELLASLDAARQLTGMADGDVSIIRVSTSDPGWLADILSPKAARFALLDLRVSKAQVAKGEPEMVSVDVRNWGAKAGTVTVMFSEQGQMLGETAIDLNASGSKTINQEFVSEVTGLHSVEVTIAGDLPVRLWANYSVVEPYLEVAAPAKVLLGQTFNLTVTKFDGGPASTAHVSYDSQIATVDSEGRVMFIANETGVFTATAELAGFSNGLASIKVLDPSGFPPSFVPTIVSFSITPVEIRSPDEVRGIVVIENDGTVAGTQDVVVYVDNSPALVLTVNISGMSSETLSFSMDGFSIGTRTLQVGTFARQLLVRPWFADNPDLVQFVIRYSGSSTLSSSASIPIYQAAKISQGNVAVALFAIGAISALLAALAVTSVFSKEIREGRRRLGVLKTIGASPSAIRNIVLPQALETALAGAAIGVAFGIIVADQLSRSSLFFLFGHELSLEFDPGLLVLLIPSTVAISVVGALASTTAAIRETAIYAIKGFD
ncbi:MAG: ABC transporter permease, partial [Candidatus Thermoplasmatota archaeon]|nr:ABC transporter permease [Candidatus Thermoplasmatota archaeon]